MSFAICTRPSVVAFCVFSNKTRLPLSFSGPRHPRSVAVTANASQTSDRDLPFRDAKSSSSPLRLSEERDWFADGRDAAQQLKLELGIVGGGERGESNVHLSGVDNLGEKTKDSASRAILESGRAAALELLRDMNLEQENSAQSSPSPGSPSDTKSLRTKSGSDRKSQSATTDDHFSALSRKSHCATVCLVPPPSAAEAWARLSAARRECRDPGYFRWPPHANLLYPFLEPATGGGGAGGGDGDEDEDGGARFRAEMAARLKRAAELCEPFDVTLDSFGTFGGRRRGVLWADPKSRRGRGARDGGDDAAEVAPLLRLHGLLEEQFPACRDPRKGGTAFRPHMTVSHYESAEQAAAARDEIQARWEPVSFHVHEIFLLERRGDNGQFKIAATVPLGAGGERPVQFHDPPVSFPAMPKEEEGWVREERMALKKRRKDGFRRRRKRRGGGKGGGDTRESSPEASS